MEGRGWRPPRALMRHHQELGAEPEVCRLGRTQGDRLLCHFHREEALRPLSGQPRRDVRPAQEGWGLQEPERGHLGVPSGVRFAHQENGQ